MNLDLNKAFQSWLTRYKTIKGKPLSHHHIFILEFLETSDGTEDEYTNMLSDVGYRVLKTRCRLLKVNISERAMIALASMTTNASQVVMWGHILKNYAEDNKVSQIDLIDIRKMFIKGFPSTFDLNLLWEHQKLKGGANLLDIVGFD